MNDKPLVSVVTPSLNQAATIQATLRSVRRQTYPRIEHIVVDGGSSDGTLDILREASELEDTLRWTSEPDSGMYNALNKGFSSASGEILAYLNTDDSWFPWTVDTAVSALQRHPGAGFVFGDMLVLEISGELLLHLHTPFRLGYVRRHGFLAQPTVFLRRAVWEQAGPFDESLQLVGDCEYWMRIGDCFPGRKVNEVLAFQRNHPQAKRFAQADVLAAEIAEVRTRYPRPGKIVGDLERLEAGLWRRLFTLVFLAKTLSGRTGKGSWSHFLAQPEVRHSVVPMRFAATMLPLIGNRFLRGAIGHVPS